MSDKRPKRVSALLPLILTPERATKGPTVGPDEDGRAREGGWGVGARRLRRGGSDKDRWCRGEDVGNSGMEGIT
jgi:hypothetical protein